MTAGGRIFLAHAREDKPQVRKLYADLKARGFNPWLDEIDIIPGQLWKTEITKAIREAEVFLACLSSRSVGKIGHVQDEFRQALAAFAKRPPGSIYLIPVRLDECEVPDLQIPHLGLSLRDIHWVDLWEEGGLGRLVNAIRTALDSGRSTAVPLSKPAAATDEPTVLRQSTQHAVEAEDRLDLRDFVVVTQELLSQPINEETLEAYTKWKYPDLPVDEKIQRLLLRDIDKHRYKNLGDIDRAADRTSDAVNCYRNEQPEWFDAGTDYLTKSLGFGDEDFRERHPFGSETRKAFLKYSHLVRSEPQSRRINPLSRSRSMGRLCTRASAHRIGRSD
jgi:TIR domain